MSKFSVRQFGLPGFELGDYIQESIDFLREHEPPEGYYVGFSGGKDSITMLRLCQIAGVRHKAFYSCTRIDPPEVMRFIKREYPQVEWLYPKKSFWDMIVEKQPPLRMVRWCCNELKKKPSLEITLDYRLMGIRKEESVNRAKYPRIDKYRKRKSQILLKPIFHWPEWAVWDFIDAEKLPYPVLYDEGWSRIGCVICPFIMGTSPGQIANRNRSMDRWPGVWKAFRHAVGRWFDTKMANGLRPNQRYKTAEDFWQAYLRGGELEDK